MTDYRWFHSEGTNGKIFPSTEVKKLVEQQGGKMLKQAKAKFRGGQLHYYVAVKKGDVVTAEIYSMSLNPYSQNNVGYHIESENDCPPVFDKCPANILDLLTPTDNIFAKVWRERCRANAAK